MHYFSEALSAYVSIEEQTAHHLMTGLTPVQLQLDTVVQFRIGEIPVEPDNSGQLKKALFAELLNQGECLSPLFLKYMVL